jgi:hypothetical protein
LHHLPPFPPNKQTQGQPRTYRERETEKDREEHGKTRKGTKRGGQGNKKPTDESTSITNGFLFSSANFQNQRKKLKNEGRNSTPSRPSCSQVSVSSFAK